MPSSIRNVLFAEPSGRPNTAVQFAGALLFVGIYAYAWRRGNADSSEWLLVMSLGATLAGIAEFLPKDRQLAAGICRLTAIGVLVSLLVAIIFAPEFIIG